MMGIAVIARPGARRASMRPIIRMMGKRWPPSPSVRRALASMRPIIRMMGKVAAVLTAVRVEWCFNEAHH